MKLVAVVAVLGLAGCATSSEVTEHHPYAADLLAPCELDQPMFLYRSKAGDEFSVHRTEMITYSSDGVPIEYPADAVVPKGTHIEGDRITIEHSMTVASGVWIHGQATTPDGKTYKVRHLVESLIIDLEQWQQRHGVMASPTDSDYLQVVSKRQAPWCPTNRSSRHRVSSLRSSHGAAELNRWAY